MPYGQRDDRKLQRQADLLRTLAAADIRNRQMKIDRERQTMERRQVGEAIQPYLDVIKPRQERREVPMETPQSPARTIPGANQERLNIPRITPTEERDVTSYASPGEVNRTLDESIGTLAAHGTELSDRAIARMNLLRPKSDINRTPFEAYTYGGPEEKQSVREYLSLTEKQGKKEHDELVDEYDSESGYKVHKYRRPDGTFYEQRVNEKSYRKPGGNGTGGGAGLSDSERISIKKEIARLTEKAVKAGNAMKIINSGRQYTYIDEDGTKQVIKSGTPEADAFKETMQNTIDATNKSLEEFNKEIGGTYKAEDEPATAMTRSSFIEDFKNDTGRDPSEKELEVAKKKGFWE